MLTSGIPNTNSSDLTRSRSSPTARNE
jgi:hypothetical protein